MVMVMDNNQDDTKLTLSVAEAARALSIGKCLTYELIRQGRLPAVRLGERRLVVPKAALEKFLLDQGAPGSDKGLAGS